MKKPLFTLVLAGLPLLAGSAMAEESFSQWLFTLDRMKEFRPVDNETYAEECGACHFAYPPGLLLAMSWQKLLDPVALEDHFGENAELGEDTLAEIQAYVIENSAENSYYKRARKITRSVQSIEPPLRITQVPYIKRKHHELTAAMVRDNPEVGSLSNCNACHTQAEQAVFDDDSVQVPNFQHWDE
ncbi:MAG: cytochrome C [Pseudomonadales bacterium]|nr:cytochrome C [Pseudomonadales bacterium]